LWATPFPPEQCLVAGCAGRITPEYEFTSTDPDIADFVRQDPASSNLRKPFLDANDKVVSDARSGLLCPFNAGTTTVTVSAGAFSFSETLRVLDGSVQRPCGTRPLRPDRFKQEQPASVPTPPPVVPAAAPPAPPAPPPPPAPPTPPVPPPPPAILPAVPIQGPTLTNSPTIPPPPPPPAIRPLPPGGAPGRVYQVEEKREEEAAPEQSQAFSRYEPDDGGPPVYLIGLALIAAVAGVGMRGAGGGGSRQRVRPAPARSAARDIHRKGERPW